VCSYDAVSLFYLELYVKLSIYLSIYLSRLERKQRQLSQQRSRRHHPMPLTMFTRHLVSCQVQLCKTPQMLTRMLHVRFQTFFAGIASFMFPLRLLPHCFSMSTPTCHIEIHVIYSQLTTFADIRCFLIIGPLYSALVEYLPPWAAPGGRAKIQLVQLAGC
jgi:hypothetical protein